jgi:subtilisin family serine protease
VVGVAPGASLYAVKVLDAQGSGSDAEVVAGLDWVSANAASLNIKVVNMSLGRPASSDDSFMHGAIQDLVTAGVTVVVSAGNDCGAEVGDLVPSGFSEVIAVGSTTAKAGTSAYANIQVPADMASYFTTDGVGVTVSAPGEESENVMKGYRLQSVGILSLRLGGGTTRMAGTSMASPHVAGVAALIYQKFPLLTPAAVKSRIANNPTAGSAPRPGITTCYTADGELEGVVSAVSATGP